MPRHPGRVVLRHRSARPRILPVLWGAGAAVDGAWSYGVDTWAEAYRVLDDHRRRRGSITELQVWSHGYRGRPELGDGGPELPRLARAVGTDLVRVWWRSCDVHRSHSFAIETVQILGAESIGHCAVISAPWPWQQRAICAYTPAELAQGLDPWWPKDGAGLRACSALSMRVPAHAYRSSP